MGIFSKPFTAEEQLQAGLVAAAVLSVLLVVLSTYGRRRLSHPAVRLLVLGASMVYLPVMSYIISSLLRKREYESNTPPGRNNRDSRDMWTVLLWGVLILTIKGDADTAAAATGATTALPASGVDVSIDGQRISPSVGILFQYAWLGKLVWECLPEASWIGHGGIAIFIAFSAVGLAKTVLKLAAFYSANFSFALGKNARLIAGYMEQLATDGGGHEQEQVPRYIVMGERTKHVEERPQGYRVKRDALENRFGDLVTLDRVWRLAEHGDGVIARRWELRDLCLSFSLFKILRRRLSGYPLADAGSSEALEFVLRGMDSAGGSVDQDRVFRVLLDELWFASDFYFSPVPLCILSLWSAALNFLFSILNIAGAIAVATIYKQKDVVSMKTGYMVITYCLLVAFMLVEIWEIIAGVCSNWTKMALLGHYIRHESLWQRYSCTHGALAAVLRLRPARRWRDKIGQNSMLEPRRFRSHTGLLSEKLYGPSGLMKSIKVSSEVKDAVLMSLQSSYGRLSKGSVAGRRVGGHIDDWALYGSNKKSSAWNDDDERTTTDLILMWHVGTRLFEMKSTSASSEMIAASHLSNYCMYLVAAAPELLPDCADWTKKRYEEVAKDVRAALGSDVGSGRSESAAERYEHLVTMLSHDSRHAVLQRGAEIGRHLVEEYTEDHRLGCRILADFWSEMLLYAAPSENVKAHVEAIARGGEFITLVWALLLHAGIMTRPETPAGYTMV